jgi:hypothetical protein
VQNKNPAFWVKKASGTGLSRKSFKNGCCRKQKQNCDLRLARCFGQLLMQISTKNHWDAFYRSLRADVKARFKNFMTFRLALTDNAYSPQCSGMAVGKTGASTIFNAC